MQLSDIPVPEIYRTSSDFRFFLNWFSTALLKIQRDTERLPDLYDPLRCPSWLLWMLADTIGFKYDDRLPTAYNRLVILYFMSMIRNRGSKDGVTLAAEVNLAQFNILDYGKEKDILYNRLEDTSIPINAAYVTPHTAEGYIDIVYFSTQLPVDACIEYVRPLGMYINARPGVRFDARTKISIDARLTHIADAENTRMNQQGHEWGHTWVTHVGHYSRADFARMQKPSYATQPQRKTGPYDARNQQHVYYRNSQSEGTYNRSIDPGYRSLYSLQVCNNEHIYKSLIKPIFGLGYTPTADEAFAGDTPLPPTADTPKTWNLRYDKTHDEYETPLPLDVYTVEPDGSTYIAPKPAVNPIMTQLGDAIALNNMNTRYTEADEDGNLKPVDK